MRTVRTLIPVLVGATLVLACACSRRSAPVASRSSRSFPAGEGKLVRIELRSVAADVTVRPGDTIEVATELTARSSSAAFSRRWIREHEPVMEDSPATLAIREPEHKSGLFFVGFLHTRARVTVALPPSCRLEVKTTSGDVDLEGGAAMAATTRIETGSGDVSIGGGSSDLAVHTVSGDVEISGDPLDVLDVETASGDVRVDAEVRQALAETGSGDLRLNRLAGNLSAVTSSGNVAATWDAAAATGELSIRSRSGDVVLRLPEGLAVSGVATTRTGHISSRFQGSWSDRERTLTLSRPGGISVSLHTSSGRISLRHSS